MLALTSLLLAVLNLILLTDIMRSKVADTRPSSPAKTDAMKVSGGRPTARTLGAPSLRLPARTLSAVVVSADASDDEDATSQELGSGTYVDAPPAPQLSEDVVVHTLQDRIS
ncbi:uncharacterized protein LOC112558214 [Pomacea canaliculata]|uniref:uncharacterized protein LOC112558214 n=1 Tax=Pomacea canaliculata TaxID=400727 RepID=UPI000D73B092|nr:uncharacterized protein LOC112558214 [Pomacea canaliculata]